jgi:hypothetical protein
MNKKTGRLVNAEEENSGEKHDYRLKKPASRDAGMRLYSRAFAIGRTMTARMRNIYLHPLLFC